ncbi:MAG: sarcosine oxidase subunit gamma [Pseudomonadota bacterium]
MGSLAPIETLFLQPSVQAGLSRLTLLPLMQKTWLAPWPGTEQDFSAALSAELGLTFPAPGQVHQSGKALVYWAGRNAAFLIGAEPPVSLGVHGAVVDVSDGWVRFRLEGEDGPSVMARLCAVDLRPGVFAEETSLRTQVGHVTALIIAGRKNETELWVTRSYAAHLHEELVATMRAVAARRDLRD